MDVSYRRDKDHNYMILDAPGELTGEEYQVHALVHSTNTARFQGHRTWH